MYADEDALYVDFLFEQPMREMFWHTPTDRKVVCKHWLRGLCKKGNNCNFLHIHMTSKMPLCQFFQKYGFCTQSDCKYIHLNADDERARCPWYDRGFCKHGEKCRHRHIKREICPDFLWGFCPLGKECGKAHPSFDFPQFLAAGEAIPEKKGEGGAAMRPFNAGGSQNFDHITCHNCGETGHFRDQCPHPPKPGGGGPGGSHSDRTCYTCRQAGHISANCPNGGGPAGRAGGGGSGGDRVCFRCGEPGHIAARCPNPPRDGGPGGSFGRPPQRYGYKPEFSGHGGGPGMDYGGGHGGAGGPAWHGGPPRGYS